MNSLEMTDTEIMAIADPIMDNLMQASTEIDYERHIRDFSDRLKSIVTKENLEQQCKEYQAELGFFSKKRAGWYLQKKHRCAGILAAVVYEV